jgi:peptidyl-dipeptidase A
LPSTLDTVDAREAALSEFIERLTAEIIPLSHDYQLATWDLNVTGEARFTEQATRLGTQLRQVYARPEAYMFLSGVEAAGGVGEARFARQLRLLLNQHRAQQIPAESIARTVRMEEDLSHRLNTFRALLEGERVSDNAIREILRESGDVALRQRAWEASKQVGAEVVNDLLALVRLRNENARHIGYPDYYRMMLELQEVDADELFGILDAIERGTDAPFAAYRAVLDQRLAKRFGIAPTDVRPWHMADPFFQQAPASEVRLDAFYVSKPLEPLAERFFTSIGLDVRDVLARSDLYEKPGKCQHAFCTAIDRDGDIRVLCNLRSDEKWMGTLLHELGHAAYDRYVDPELPWLLRGHAHIMSTEASAMLFGRLSRNAAWLERYAGVPGDEARRMGAAARESVRIQLLVATRWILVMCHMERALYADPEQDLNTLWWDLVERFQLLPRPEGRSAPDWASKIHFSVAPVYYHNYLLGEMTASQLHRHVLAHVLGGGEDAESRFVADPAVGRFMIDAFYRPGRTRDWRGTLEHATGAPLDPGPYIRELAGDD